MNYHFSLREETLNALEEQEKAFLAQLWWLERHIKAMNLKSAEKADLLKSIVDIKGELGMLDLEEMLFSQRKE